MISTKYNPKYYVAPLNDLRGPQTCSLRKKNKDLIENFGNFSFLCQEKELESYYIPEIYYENKLKNSVNFIVKESDSDKALTSLMLLVHAHNLSMYYEVIQNSIQEMLDKIVSPKVFKKLFEYALLNSEDIFEIKLLEDLESKAKKFNFTFTGNFLVELVNKKCTFEGSSEMYLIAYKRIKYHLEDTKLKFFNLGFEKNLNWNILFNYLISIGNVDKEHPLYKYLYEKCLIESKIEIEMEINKTVLLRNSRTAIKV